MAEDLQFASRADNKRKYEDQTTPPSSITPPARRPTGFSAPIASPSPDAPPPSYNNVPPPADEIQLAKQRAQEIAARLFSNAEAKRPRVENGDGGPVRGLSEESNDKGFSSGANDLGQKPPGPPMANIGAPAAIPVAYGFQGASKKMDIPNGRVGVIIGKGGETIKYLQLQSGAKIQVTRDMDADPNSQTRPVELMGTPEQIAKAEQLINDVLQEADAGGSGIVAARRFGSGQLGAEQFIMKVPNNKVGLIIGKGGETIKNMQARSGARIQLIPLHLPPGDMSTERTVQIDGTKEQIESAKQLVDEVCSENRVRPPMGGGYPQQGFRPPRPPTNWAPTGPPVQQPGYGYMQPGAYPGPPPQYNMAQPPYAGYPPQPTSGGYSSGWDQNTAPPSQPTAQGTGYDYYGQQPPQQQQPAAPGGSSASADNASYNYGQPPASNYNQQGSYGESNYSQPPVGQQQQGYNQDGYGSGYHAPAPQAGYSQPQSSLQPGYEQQPPYSSAPTYGATANPAQDGTAPYGAQGGPTQPPQQVPPPVQPPAANQQGYTGQPPATTTSYGSQATSQPGYGMPPTSQPGYGSQPPSQAGYAQSVPVAQPGYGQPPQGQKPPPTQPVYGQTPPTQGGYVQPGYSHSQPPVTQSGYGQQDGHHRAQPSGYGSTTQPSYGQQQSYGAPPPVTQPGYGQQQYGDSYGSGYQQPSAYPADNAVGGNVHGTYDAPPGAQPVQSGVAKASPPS